MTQTIIVIGAGIAGLAAGCYGQMNGYQTQIFELHDKPGGLCTSWKRKGYTFDGCIQWLVGTRDGSLFNSIWRELGALQGRQVVDHEEFMRIEGPDGKTLVIYTNLDRLEQHMKELAPQDAKFIEEFCNEARRCSRFGQSVSYPGAPTGLFKSIAAILKMVPYMGSFKKYARLSIKDYVSGFSDPFLRQAILSLFALEDFPILAMLVTLGWMNNQNAGYPIGGSLEFARAIEQRYFDLGGEIRYRSKVEKILVEKGGGNTPDRAVGVRLTDGTEFRADVVISAADGRATIFDMLDGKYVSDEVRKFYDEWPIFQPMIQVSLGVNRDLSSLPHATSLYLDKPIVVSGKEQQRLNVHHYCFDPTMAPPGKSVIVAGFWSGYDYWQERYQDRERYDAEKQQVAVAVINEMEKRYPGITQDIEVVDVATPVTTERYTGNWQGSIEGWLITTQHADYMMAKKMNKTLPGLDDFFMVGQWVEPGGGLPPAALSGRNVIQAICKRDEKPFSATQAPD